MQLKLWIAFSVWLILASSASAQLLAPQQAPAPVDDSRTEALMVLDPSAFINLDDEAQVKGFVRTLQQEFPGQTVIYAPFQKLQRAFVITLGRKNMDELRPSFARMKEKYPQLNMRLASINQFKEIVSREHLTYDQLIEMTQQMISN